MAITAEEVTLGTAFGARYPDFQDRPRPRFVDPYGILIMVFVGMTVLVLTALPAIVSGAVGDIPGNQVQALFLASLAFAVAVTGLSYSWASRETKKLFVEFKW